MGDENFTPATGGFLLRASDDGEWESIGYIGADGITFPDSDDFEVWQGKLLELRFDYETGMSRGKEWERQTWVARCIHERACGRKGGKNDG